MKKKSPVLLCFTFFLLGIVLGFSMSPIKEGISIGNNSGNVYDCSKPTPKSNQKDI